MLLMLNVATRTGSLSVCVLICLLKGATEFVVPAGIILLVERNGNPRTEMHIWFWWSPV
jgi:hypothetical protein